MHAQLVICSLTITIQYKHRFWGYVSEAAEGESIFSNTGAKSLVWHWRTEVVAWGLGGGGNLQWMNPGSWDYRMHLKKSCFIANTSTTWPWNVFVTAVRRRTENIYLPIDSDYSAVYKFTVAVQPHHFNLKERQIFFLHAVWCLYIC